MTTSHPFTPPPMNIEIYHTGHANEISLRQQADGSWLPATESDLNNATAIRRFTDEEEMAAAGVAR